MQLLLPQLKVVPVQQERKKAKKTNHVIASAHIRTINSQIYGAGKKGNHNFQLNSTLIFFAD